MSLRNAQLTRGIKTAGQFYGGFRNKTKVISATYTVKASDSGYLLIVSAADLVLTLPATAKGYLFRFVLAAAGLSAGTGLSISPATVDKFIGNGFTPLDNKDAILAGSGDRAGDYLQVEGDGVDGYYITGVIGTWTRE